MTSTIWIFALGQMGWAMLAGIISNWLVYFYQPSQESILAGQTLFIQQGNVIFRVITIIGLITFIGRIFDAFTDPLIANLSDKSKNPKGRRIPFMRKIAIPFSIVTTLVFCAPKSTISSINTLWLFITLMGFYLCMTIYCTPYNALIPVIGHDQKSRIAVSTAISLTFIIGTSLAYLAPVIWNMLGTSFDRVTAMRITFGSLSVIACILMLIPTFFIDERKLKQVQPSNENAFQSLKLTFKNKDFRSFVYSDVLYFTALTIFQTGLPFFVVSLMGLKESHSATLFVLMTALSLLWYPIVNILAPKFGKKKMVMFAFIVFAVDYVLTALSGIIGFGGLAWGILVVAIASISMAILGILPQAMVADVAQEDEVNTKVNRNGMFFAARTFAFKLGQSIAMLIFTGFAAKGVIGYRLASLTAAVLCVLACIALTRYNEKRILETCIANQ
ncbi:MAG: MFS transporter [Sphaerochaetaceae bacterium]|nr:MFS transporter [Sphaerochaetaceae bacterium]